MQCLPSLLELRIEVQPQLVLSVSLFEHTVSFVSTTRLFASLLRGSAVRWVKLNTNRKLKTVCLWKLHFFEIVSGFVHVVKFSVFGRNTNIGMVDCRRGEPGHSNVCK